MPVLKLFTVNDIKPGEQQWVEISAPDTYLDNISSTALDKKISKQQNIVTLLESENDSLSKSAKKPHLLQTFLRKLLRLIALLLLQDNISAMCSIQ